MSRSWGGPVGLWRKCWNMSELRVVVAMSGGVDSSVAAALLVEKGYEVIGLTMQLWEKGSGCCSLKDVTDARRVARILNIPHYVVSLKDAFEQDVIDYFISEYKKGRTPNPCAVCNPKIKFGALMEKASSLGAEFLVTGHYAGIKHDSRRQRYILTRGKERWKDQSYFLARLSQDALGRALFPVGRYSKDKSRKLARRFGLPVAEKKESQEVCFIPDGDVAGFIQKKEGHAFPSGRIKDTEGHILGEHNGVIGYTIGQRKGLGIAAGERRYVTKIDPDRNTITIGDDDSLYRDCFEAVDPHWISVSGIQKSFQAGVQIRYKHEAARAEVIPLSKERLEIKFRKPQRAITPGQLAVFYHRNRVIGSAWIDRVLD
jgi:tRNA-specific 2-thiouridylase